MVKRRVLIAALPCAVGWVLSPSSPAHADPPIPDPPPAAPAYDSWGIDPTGEAPPAQDVQVAVAADAYADTDPSALSDFRATLDPHGTWVQDPTYGTVWVPSPEEVGADFTPYVSAGRWAYDGDYVWISDYVWGWVAFHYGRWERIREMGWAWIPGRAYAGAWVSWRLGSDEFAFVGWAALPPAWAWRDGFPVATGLGPWQAFVYCPQGEVFAPAIGTRVVSGAPAAAIAPHTRTYVPANPIVDGATVPPTGAPSKAAAWHPTARPAPHGPPPALLGIDPSRVVHRSSTDRGLASALAYARPSTAQALGAHAPVTHLVRAMPAVVPHYAAAPAERAPKRR
jgi:hypothetical protein